MHGGRSFDRDRFAPFRLGLERLEPRDLPSVLAPGRDDPPMAVPSAGHIQSGTDSGTTNQVKDGDDDDASYHSSDPSSPTGETGQPKPKTVAVTVTDRASGVNYANVSPVGYEHGQPVGPTGRVALLSPFTPATVVGSDAKADVAPPDAPVRSAGPVLSDLATTVLVHLAPSIAIGITTDDEPDHHPPTGTEAVAEIPSGGADGTTATPAAGPADEAIVRVPPVIAAVVPAGLAAAAEDVLHALDSLGVVPDVPTATWERIYVWGTATAAIALGIELARRYRSTARARNWDELG
jgi:hypothetical protein